MANETNTYLKYALLQMAAESLFDIKPTAAPGTATTFMNEGTLTIGNTHASRFTSVQAAQFVKDWKVVEHISNTSTGFSGTLFSLEPPPFSTTMPVPDCESMCGCIRDTAQGGHHDRLYLRGDQ